MINTGALESLMKSKELLGKLSLEITSNLHCFNDFGLSQAIIHSLNDMGYVLMEAIEHEIIILRMNIYRDDEGEIRD